MASLDIIVLGESDSEDIQAISDIEVALCQICQIPLTNRSARDKQAHYDHHFDEEKHPPLSLRKKDTPMNLRRRMADRFWYIHSNDTVPDNYSPGLIPVLKQALTKSHAKGNTTRASLCEDGVVHISAEIRDSLWGCGYRNFMMCCTALLSQDIQTSYSRQILLEPCPGVRNLQRWIESAWSEGYDKEGKADLSPLLGKNKWIGTVEISVAFTYRGIPTKLVDFPDVDKNAEVVTNWIMDYFDSGEPSSNKHLAGILTPEKRSIGDVLRGACPIKVTDRMPLILQHKGHSRTIVGYEVTKNGVTNLLTFDPASSKAPSKKIRQAGIAQLFSQEKSTASCSTSKGKGKQILGQIFHPRRHHRSDEDSASCLTVDHKGKKRQASPSPGPSRHVEEDSRSVKRVRGGVHTNEHVVAATSIVEVIDLDDEDCDEVQCTEKVPMKRKGSKATEALDPSEVLSRFRLSPAVVGKNKKYQILYFTMEYLLSEEQKKHRKTVHSTPIRQSTTKGNRT